MAAACLHAAREPADGLAVLARNTAAWQAVSAVLAAGGPAAPLTSSAGRLFDAVSALAGICDLASYDGQAAAELEQHADRDVRDGYPVTVTGGPPVVIRSTDLVRAVAADLRGGVATGVIAARFHHGLAGAVAAAVRLVADATGLGTVALSGGVFANTLLLGGVSERLRGHGFRVLTHHRVPCNDGGLSLGQAVAAAARLTARN
jgi:hydrogenase maturation protein HypF